MASPQKSSGTITSDPSVSGNEEADIISKPITVKHNFQRKELVLKDWSSFNGILLSIHFHDKLKHSVEGSAVIVAPGIALCAKHVVEDHFDILKKNKEAVYATGIAPSGLQIWRIKGIHIDKSNDLAILILRYNSVMPPDNTFYRAIISTRLPKIGENLLIAGFRAAEHSFEIKNNELYCEGTVLVCNGEVTQRFEQGRDSGMLPGPALEVNCTTWGGMSGGPVFDSNGYLIGLLSSSFDNGPPSFVSLTWPILAYEFNGGWPEEHFKTRTSLLGMAEDRCAIDNRSAVQVRKINDGKGMTIRYDIWE